MQKKNENAKMPKAVIKKFGVLLKQTKKIACLPEGSLKESSISYKMFIRRGRHHKGSTFPLKKNRKHQHNLIRRI